jgi:hypothetical protein
VTLEQALAPLASAGQARPAVHWVAAITFALLLLAMGVGFMRAKKRVEHDDVERLLEADFRRLERNFGGNALPPKDGG